MTPAEIIAAIVETGGQMWTEGNRLKFRGIPSRLVPAIREHKAGLLALLNDYDQQERLAIQTESDTPPDRGWGAVQGFDPFERMTDTTQAAKIAPRATMALQSAPATVRCESCAEFEPGTPVWARGIGKCAKTATGLPPVSSRGYGACFPSAPRICPDYQEAPP